MHEHKPIQSDSELVCASCGVVLASTIELPELPDLHNLININNYTMQTTIHEKWNARKTSYYNFQVLKVFNRFQKILEKEQLPQSFANQALKTLIMRNKGLWSIKWQIMTLIQTLDAANPTVFKNAIRNIREEYRYAKGT